MEDVLAVLREQPDITHVSMIHSETTSGLINLVGEVGRAVKTLNPHTIFIVDAMSSFGAHEIDL